MLILTIAIFCAANITRMDANIFQDPPEFDPFHSIALWHLEEDREAALAVS